MRLRCRGRSLPAAALALVLAAGSLAAQSPPAPPPVQPQTVVRVKPTLFMITGAGSNVTVWVSNHGVILVDDKLGGEANFANLVAAVRSITPLPVRAVFDTHHHADHIGNNGRFIAANVLVVGADALTEALAHAPANGLPPPEPPNVTFSQKFSLILDTGRADAYHYQPGHAGDDTVVFFPAVHAVAAGDLVVGATPTIDYAGGANVGGWIAALDEMLKLDFDTAIPGHGDAPMTRSDVAAFRQKLVAFRDRTRAAIAAGATVDTLVERTRVDDLGWTWSATAWPPARREGLWREMNGRKQ